MKYRVSREESGISVDLSDLGNSQEALIETFAACSDGRCRCPLADSVDLTSVDLLSEGGSLRVTIPINSDSEVDSEVLERCLEGKLKRLKE